MTKARNKKVLIISFVIIAITYAVAVIANIVIGAWAFVPLSIVYWTSIFIAVKPTRKKFIGIFATPTENRKYAILAFVPVLFCIISFVWGIQHISGAMLIAMWIIFALVNSTAEELFWRGYLFNNLSWTPLVKILLSTALFMLSHLAWGVFSVTIRHPLMIAPLLIMGLVWGYVYHKTNSLKWCILAHFLVNILILTVWVFLNIYVPPVV